MKYIYRIFISKISRKNKGFTLIEIIIAFAIFAIMMGGIYGIIISAMNNNKAGEIKQKAALYAQKIFEDIKSGEIIKDGYGKIKINNNIELNKDDDDKYSWSGYLDDKNDYYAYIEMNKNKSLLFDNDEEKHEDSFDDNNLIDRTFNFNVDLIGDNTPIRVKSNSIEDGKLEYDINSNENIKLIINTKIEDNEKLLIIKDKNNKEILKDKIQITNEELKKESIKLNFNFLQYKIFNSESNENKYRNMDIDVFNQDEVPLNIILNKSKELDVKVSNKLGTIRVYDNRFESNESLKNGQLYDIKIEIKQKPNDTTSVFNGYSSQNINIE